MDEAAGGAVSTLTDGEREQALLREMARLEGEMAVVQQKQAAAEAAIEKTVSDYVTDAKARQRRAEDAADGWYKGGSCPSPWVMERVSWPSARPS